MKTESGSIRRFRSRLHPGEVSAPVAFGAFLVKPIGAVMTPVMVVGVILVLQQVDPLPYVLWACPLALCLAGAWTWFRIRSLTVEIVVTHNGAAALTVLEAVSPRHQPRIQRVFDARSMSAGAQVTIGRASYILESADWPDLHELVSMLSEAKAFYD